MSEASPINPEREAYKQDCVRNSFLEGAKWGGLGLLGGLPATYALNSFWSGFRRLNVGAKTAVAISPGLFIFWLVSEQEMVRCMKARRFSH